MSNELKYDGQLGESGLTLYAVLVNDADATRWNTSGTPAWDAPSLNVTNQANHAITMTESPSLHWEGTFPATIAAGLHVVVTICERAGAGAVVSADRVVSKRMCLTLGSGAIAWCNPGDLQAIKGTKLPAESVAGYDAAAFGKFLDVAMPVFTCASVNQTGAGASTSDMLAQAKAALVFYDLDHLTQVATGIPVITAGTFLAQLAATMGWAVALDDWQAVTDSGTHTVRVRTYHNGNLANPASIVLSASTGAYGVKRTDNNAVVVADDVAMTTTSTGVHEYLFTEPVPGLTFAYSVEIVSVAGAPSIYVAGTIAGQSAAASGTAGAFGWTVNTMAEHVRGLLDIDPDAAGGTVPDRVKKIIREKARWLYSVKDWRFRSVAGTVSVSAGDSEIVLPADFGELDVSVMRTTDTARYRLLWTADPERWQAMKDRNYAAGTTGPPRIAVPYWDETTGQWKAKIAPTADAAYTFGYWYLRRNPWNRATPPTDDTPLSPTYWPESFDEGWRIMCEAVILSSYTKDERGPILFRQAEKWKEEQREDNDEAIASMVEELQDAVNDLSYTMRGAFDPGSLPGGRTLWYGSI